MRLKVVMSRAMGFGLSMGLLVIVSLIMIPSMVRASGGVAWGAIALGQAIGGVGSVFLAFGWAMNGPARIAVQGAEGRRQEFVESVRARLALVLPVTLLCAVVSAFSAVPEFRWMAAVGAVSTAAIGLSSNWFFVGTVQPYALLFSETLPRVLGTLLGVVLMEMGSSAGIGVLCQLLGMLSAFVVESFVILRGLSRQGATACDPRPIGQVLRGQGDGVFASVGSASLNALPVVIVSWVRPDVQPVYAFADKLARQIVTAMSPIVTVFQGWVPRGKPVLKRAHQVLVISLAGCLLLVLGVVAFGPFLVGYLGGGVISVKGLALLAMSLYVGAQVLENIVSHAVLPPLHAVRAAAISTWATGMVTLPLVAVAALRAGAGVALMVVVAGLVIRTIWELVAAGAATPWRRAVAPRRALPDEDTSHGR